MSKLGLNMIRSPELVVTNAVRVRKVLANDYDPAKRSMQTNLVMREAWLKARVPAAEAARVEIARRARLMRDNPEALATRQALIEVPEVTYVERVTPQKVRRYKGKVIARTHRY